MPKFKLPKFNIKGMFGAKKVKSSTGDYMTKGTFIPNQKVRKLMTSFARYLVLLSLTVIFFIIGSISLPLTEKVYPDVSFDIVEKDYVSKSYIIELKIKKSDKNEINEKIAQTKRILSKRLYKAGAQQVSITGYHSDKVTNDDDNYYYRQIQVKVVGAIDELDMDQVVYVRSYMRFYTFNEDVDLENDETGIAQYMPTNYTKADFTRYDFRNIYIKKVVDKDGNESYQAIFKTWPFDSKFQKFISDNAGKKIGIGGLDYSGAIIPLDLPITYSDSLRKMTGEPFVFSLNLNGEKRQADLSGIQFNSGVIPIEYSIVDQKVLEYQEADISHIFLAGAILLIIIGFAIFQKFILKEKAVDSMVKLATLGFTFATFFAVYKFLLIPMDLSLVYITSLLFIVLAYVISSRNYDNNDYLITLAILATSWLIGFGVVKEIAFSMMILVTLHIIIKDVVKYYLINMSKFIEND